MLVTAMILHRYNADDLLIGTMISLPKDNKLRTQKKRFILPKYYILYLFEQIYS